METSTRNPSVSQAHSPQLQRLLAESLEDVIARNAERCRSFGMAEAEVRKHIGNVRSMVAQLTIRLVCKDGHFVTEEGI